MDLSVSEYAKSQGVTPQAIYKQIDRYKKDLARHLHKRGRTTFLDDYAQSFLDEKRANNKVIIKKASETEEIKALQEENKRLLLKVNELQDQVIRISGEKEKLQERVIAMLEVKAEEPKEEPKELPKEVPPKEPPKEEEKSPEPEVKHSFFYRLFHKMQ